MSVAVVAVLINKPKFLKSAITVLSAVNYNFCCKMSNWQIEKEKYLSLDIKSKRSTYGKFIELKDLQTWKQYASIKGPNIVAKIGLLPRSRIDESKNDALADKISFFSGDITHLEIDAIVNAANKTLLGGGGVDGCIHRASGPLLKQECQTLGGCETGEAKITGGYKLPARYVIHTVGPIGENTDLLSNCYRNSLSVMLKNRLRTIAFPCISTGIYGYPNLAAAHVAAYTVRMYLESHADKIDRVIFCLFLDEDKKIYEGLLQSYFPIK